jgi:hypothetical protein
MEANKNFAKWLSCGIQISGTFGLHHVQEKNVSLYEVKEKMLRASSLEPFQAVRIGSGDLRSVRTL